MGRHSLGPSIAAGGYIVFVMCVGTLALLLVGFGWHMWRDAKAEQVAMTRAALGTSPPCQSHQSLPSSEGSTSTGNEGSDAKMQSKSAAQTPVAVDGATPSSNGRVLTSSSSMRALRATHAFNPLAARRSHSTSRGPRSKA